MSPALAVTTLSTLFFSYALVLAFAWVRAVRRTDMHDHVGHFIGLMGVFVPGMSLTIGALLLAAVLHSPVLALLLPVFFTGALATGLHLEVDNLTRPEPVTEALRIVLAVCVAILLVELG